MVEETYLFYPTPQVKILHLQMQKKWFDMILSGEKKEEYRLCTPHWVTRVKNWTVDNRQLEDEFSLGRPNVLLHIRFFNGYQENAPQFTMMCKRYEFRSKSKHPEWGENEYDGKDHFVFHLGSIVERKGC